MYFGTMSVQQPWFRFYRHAMRHERVTKLSDKDFRLWMELLCVADPETGYIPANDTLKRVLRRRLDHLSTALKRIASVGLIHPLSDGYELHKWNDLQFKSDTSTKRVQKHREKVKRSETVVEQRQSRAEQIVVNDKSSTTSDDDVVFDLVDFTDRAARAAGVRHIDPGRIVQHNDLVREWMGIGASETDIISVISKAVGTAKEPIRSMNYFDVAIRQEVAKRGSKETAASNYQSHDTKKPSRPVAELEHESEAGLKIKLGLRKQLGATIFDQWFGPTAILFDEGAITVVAPSQFATDWIKDRYGEQIKKLSGTNNEITFTETQMEPSE